MNKPRVASLLRSIANASRDANLRALFLELAEAVEEEENASNIVALRPRGQRRPRTMARPAGEASPAVARRAAEILAKAGFR